MVWGFEPEDNDWDVVQVETAYWQTGGEFWVVEDNDQIVGSGGYHPCDRTLPIEDTIKSTELRKMFFSPSGARARPGALLINDVGTIRLRKGLYPYVARNGRTDESRCQTL